jgi:hypothetical protein
MAAPDPESFGLLGKVAVALTAIGAPVGWLWSKLDRKLDKSDFRDFMERFDKHVEHDQAVQAKLFDKCDEIKDLLQRLK